MAHNVTVENTFSGPMDLLLYLVRRDEIDIHDIPVSHLTREYLAELDKLELIDVDAGGEFVAMASLLTELKSRMLLPVAPEEEGAEDEESFDPRTGLVRALLEYKRFKEVAAELEAKAREHLNRFSRCAPPPEFSYIIRGGAQELGALDLFAAFQKIARKYLNESRPREIINEEVATEVRIAQIEELLKQRPRVSFTSLLSDNPTRDEMVGFFIAMLELIRLKKIRAQQSIDFSEIYFFTRKPGEELPPPEEELEEAPASVQAATMATACRPLPLRLAPVFEPVRTLASPVRSAPMACLKTGSGFLPLRPVAVRAGVAGAVLARRSVAAVFAPVRTSAAKPTVRITCGQEATSTLIAAAERPVPAAEEINPLCTCICAGVKITTLLPTCAVGKTTRPMPLRLAGVAGGAGGRRVQGARTDSADRREARGVFRSCPGRAAATAAGDLSQKRIALFPAVRGGRILRSAFTKKVGSVTSLFPGGSVLRAGGNASQVCKQVTSRPAAAAPLAEIQPASNTACVAIKPPLLPGVSAAACTPTECGAAARKTAPSSKCRGGSLADPFARRTPIAAGAKKPVTPDGIFPLMRPAVRFCSLGRGARKFRLF